MGEPSGKLHAFAYLTAENAGLHRAIMQSFTEARERFVLHLRPADVARAVREEGHEAAHLDLALQQLCSWGNLQAHPDSAEVATVEDFYRQRFLYQLTPEGEAAERAVGGYFGPRLRISPRLRATGRHARPGRANDIIDQSREKALLAARREEETAALRAARARLTTGQPLWVREAFA